MSYQHRVGVVCV